MINHTQPTSLRLRATGEGFKLSSFPLPCFFSCSGWISYVTTPRFFILQPEIHSRHHFAGSEIRDMLSWLYGSGFPKSLNIGKQIDKMNGTEYPKNEKISDNNSMSGVISTRHTISIQTETAKQWEGWGTALKPACEPIVVARKPLSEKNAALNVLKWGTGGINIDECRIGTELIKSSGDKKSLQIWKENDGRKSKDLDLIENTPHWNKGRFPANVILDEEAGKMLDEQSGISKSSDTKRNRNTLGSFGMPNDLTPEYSDKGGASRFFYCAKASKSERNFGLDDFEEKKQDESRKEGNPGGDNPRNRGVHLRANHHPTVKPIKLMEYLVKLVTPKGGIVLDPFLGSGTTGIACIKNGFNFIGIEREQEYVKITEARIKHYLEQTKLM